MKIREYDREKVLAYARKWAYGRNPLYYDFSLLGGDCTNFASQCVYAGAGIMNYTPELGWYFKNLNNRAPAWTGVEYFYSFMVGNKSGLGPFMERVGLTDIQPGDVIQLRFSGMDHFSHNPVVVSVGNHPNPDNILIAAHTYDAYNRPLSSYEYEEYRPLHVVGVREN